MSVVNTFNNLTASVYIVGVVRMFVLLFGLGGMVLASGSPIADAVKLLLIRLVRACRTSGSPSADAVRPAFASWFFSSFSRTTPTKLYGIAPTPTTQLTVFQTAFHQPAVFHSGGIGNRIGPRAPRCESHSD